MRKEPNLYAGTKPSPKGGAAWTSTPSSSHCTYWWTIGGRLSMVGSRAARLVSVRIVLPRRARAPTKMGDFSQAAPRASLARKGEGARRVEVHAQALLS